MGVRNCRDIGENLKKIVKRLMANDKLVNLLYYTEVNPLEQDNLTEKEKQELIYNKLIKIIPRVGPKETANSLVVIRVVRGKGNFENPEFKDVLLQAEIFVPLTQWFIKGDNLRPFAILGEIQESLDGKTINGLGKLSGGDFELNYITDDICCYQQSFYWTSYD
jgi:hypothetical protein